MTALDELRAAIDEERQLRRSWIPTSRVTATDAALARVEAELAAAHRLYLEACECGSGHARIAELEAELAELRALAYMPTTWRCEKCRYTTKQGPPRQCPVCAGSLTRETWKQRARDWADYAEGLADRIGTPLPPGSTEPEEER